jgi:hypothetical protein
LLPWRNIPALPGLFNGGGDFRQAGVVGDFSLGSGLGSCKAEGFEVFGEGVAMEDDDEFPPPPPGSANRGNGSDMGSDEEDDVEFLNCDDSLTTDGSKWNYHAWRPTTCCECSWGNQRICSCVRINLTYS